MIYWRKWGILFLFIIAFFTHSWAIDKPPQEVTEAASRGLEDFIKKKPQRALYRHGFADRQEIETAFLGEGFHVYTILPDEFLKEDPNQNLDELLIPTNIWQFIILSHQKSKAVLSVDKFRNQWMAVSIGSAGLAKQLQKAIEAWPESDGYSWKLVRIYQARSDFVAIYQNDVFLGLVPLTSARVAMVLQKLDFFPLELHSLSEMMRILRPIVRDNLRTQTK